MRHALRIITLGGILLISLVTSVWASGKWDSLNALKNVYSSKVDDGFIIRLEFEKPVSDFRAPVFFDKSIQVDFPLAFIKPAKKSFPAESFSTTKVFAAQFDERTLRIRFIKKDASIDLRGQFHLVRQGRFVIVRFDQSLPTVDSNSITLAKSQEPPNNDLMSDDELSKFLTRAAEKFRTQEDKKVRSTIKPTKTFENTNIEKVKEAPGVKVTRAGMGIEPIVQHIKKATQQSSNSDNEEGASKSTKGQPVSKGKQKFSLNDSRPAGKPIELIPSSLKMFSMLSVVLGIMFLLFFIFKKYVLKNTLFGGGEKLINVLGSGFLGPKKNIVLVEVAGEILVLGMSQNNISLLTNITDPEKIEEIKSKGGKGASGLNWNGRGTQPKEGKTVANKVTGQFSNYMKKVSEPETKSNDKSVSDVTAQIKQKMGRFKTARA